MTSPSPVHTFSTASRLGKGLWAQYKRRAAIRKALIESAFQLAVRRGASSRSAEAFQRIVVESMPRSGPAPTRWTSRIMATVRGGSATLFDGPEARQWPARVRALGDDAARKARSRAETGDLFGDLQPTDVADAYLEEVRRYLAVASNDAYSPELAILAEQIRADAEQREIRRATPTGLRITRIALAIVAGGLIGHVADVHDGAHYFVPDWMETTVVAAFAGALASRPTLRESNRDEPAAVEIAEIITRTQRTLRRRLHTLIDQLVTIVDPSLRAPPLSTDHPLGTSTTAALDLLNERSQQAGELPLRMSSSQREALALYSQDLRSAALDLGLDDLDPPCWEAINWLADAAAKLAEDCSEDYEGEMQNGYAFLQILTTAAIIASRIEAYPAVRPPALPAPPARLLLTAKPSRRP
jgi:hypothetical protein